MPNTTYGYGMDQDQQVTTPDSSEQGAVTTLAAEETAEAAPAITMYTTSWCSDCVAAKRYLDARGLTYTEVDIEEDAEAAELVMRLNDGRRSVPTLVADGAAASLSGFSIQKAREFLSAAGLASR